VIQVTPLVDLDAFSKVMVADGARGSWQRERRGPPPPDSDVLVLGLILRSR